MTWTQFTVLKFVAVQKYALTQYAIKSLVRVLFVSRPFSIQENDATYDGAFASQIIDDEMRMRKKHKVSWTHVYG